MLLKLYEKNLYTKNYSKITINAYLRITSDFLTYLNNSNIDIQQLRKEDCLDYIINLSIIGYSKQSLNLIITGLKNFFTYLVDKHEFTFNHFDSIPKYKADKKMPFIYDKDEVILNIIKISKIEHKLVFLLLLGTGLKVSELIGIQLEHIDINNNSINIFKATIPRIIYFNETIKECLVKYLYDNQNNVYLFEKNNKAVSKSYILNILENKNIFGNNIRTSPQRLRTVFASEMLRNGMDMITLKVLLGLKSVSSVEQYKNSNFQHLIDIANNDHPLEQYKIRK